MFQATYEGVSKNKNKGSVPKEENVRFTTGLSICTHTLKDIYVHAHTHKQNKEDSW